uniref:uncharacterized protein LOC120327687 n=1 Tax=Styela clava TaxID=7725 RepID=UPI00193AB272|nr:uncharacterized protein LOC120327687 [Styela clava]
MSSCTTFSCYLQSLKTSAELEGKLDGNESMDISNEEFAERMRQASEDKLKSLNSNTSNNFRVIFPVILVISILVVIAVGFLIHRLISSFVWNNWAMPPESQEQDCPRSGRFRRRGRGVVRTISSYVDVPPSYRQVMKTKKSEMLPPTYQEVMTGAVNCAYVSDEDSVTTLGRYQINIDDGDAGEKGNTNSLVHSRTHPKTINDVHNILVHTAEIFSPPTPNNEVTSSDEQPRDNPLTGSDESVESLSSGVTVVTIADINIRYSDDDVISSENSETDSQSDISETICSAV